MEENQTHRLPPQNLEAEMSVLGGVLLENEALNRALEFLRTEDFYRESHRKIFNANISNLFAIWRPHSRCIIKTFKSQSLHS